MGIYYRDGVAYESYNIADIFSVTPNRISSFKKVDFFSDESKKALRSLIASRDLTILAEYVQNQHKGNPEKARAISSTLLLGSRILNLKEAILLSRLFGILNNCYTNVYDKANFLKDKTEGYKVILSALKKIYRNNVDLFKDKAAYENIRYIVRHLSHVNNGAFKSDDFIISFNAQKNLLEPAVGSAKEKAKAVPHHDNRVIDTSNNPKDKIYSIITKNLDDRYVIYREANDLAYLLIDDLKVYAATVLALLPRNLKANEELGLRKLSKSVYENANDKDKKEFANLTVSGLQTIYGYLNKEKQSGDLSEKLIRMLEGKINFYLSIQGTSQNKADSKISLIYLINKYSIGHDQISPEGRVALAKDIQRNGKPEFAKGFTQLVSNKKGIEAILIYNILVSESYQSFLQKIRTTGKALNFETQSLLNSTYSLLERLQETNDIFYEESFKEIAAHIKKILAKQKAEVSSYPELREFLLEDKKQKLISKTNASSQSLPVPQVRAKKPEVDTSRKVVAERPSLQIQKDFAAVVTNPNLVAETLKDIDTRLIDYHILRLAASLVQEIPFRFLVAEFKGQNLAQTAQQMGIPKEFALTAFNAAAKTVREECAKSIITQSWAEDKRLCLKLGL